MHALTPRDRGYLFDLDDTLFDHRHAVRTALGKLARGFPELKDVPVELLEERSVELLDRWHPRVQRGEVGREESGRERMRALFAHFGIRLGREEVVELRARYREEYRANWRPTPGATDLLAELRIRGPVGVVSNNHRAEQEEKIRACGLGEAIDFLVTSEEVGAMKPDARIFEAAVRRMAMPRGGIVFVGDSWEADIVGAHAAGLRPVWFNPRGVPTPAPGIARELRSFVPMATALGTVADEFGGARPERNRTILPSDVGRGPP